MKLHELNKMARRQSVKTPADSPEVLKLRAEIAGLKAEVEQLSVKKKRKTKRKKGDE